MGRGKKSVGQKMPACAYGAACTRKDCVYTHPPRPKGGKKPAVQKSDKVCLAYIAGVCPYGGQCWDQHPTDEDEINNILNEFAKKQCHFGSNCRNASCLFSHPVSETITIYDYPQQQISNEEEEYYQHEEPEYSQEQIDGEGSGSGGSGSGGGGIVQKEPVITLRMKYYEILFSFFTLKNELSMINKIDSMLDRFEGREESLFDSLSNKYNTSIYTNDSNSLEIELEQVEAHLKNMNMNSKFLFDEGTTPSEEVPSKGVSLYGGVVDKSSNHNISNMNSQPIQQSPSSLPPPFYPNQQSFIPPQQPPTIPAPERWKKAPHLTSNNSSSAASSSSSSSSSFAYPKKVIKSIPIPAHLWTYDVSRDASAFSQHTNPMDRFYAVNYSMVNHKLKDLSSTPPGSSSLLTPPTKTTSSSCSSSPPQKGYKTGVLDLHFQSTKTVYVVLDTLLDSELVAISSSSSKMNSSKTPNQHTYGKHNKHTSSSSSPSTSNQEAVWLITGTGHHTGKSHVKAGALFDAVEEYLFEGGYDFAYGKDGSGRSGAFAVYGKL